jgi:tetratricopeptide (TPR) repeat protein
MNVRGIGTAAALAVAVVALPVRAQNFGMMGLKTRVSLQRRLPAMVQLPGKTIRVRVTSAHQNTDVITTDLQSQLTTELLKNDRTLQEDENNPAVTISCQITSYAHPQPIVTQRNVPTTGATGKTTTQPANFTRITGSLNVAFQVKTGNGRVVASDNVSVNYDQEFNAAGDNTSHGILGTMGSSLHRLKGSKGTDAQASGAPTEPELRTQLLTMAVHKMAAQIVNTDETIEVFLAKKSGPIDEGDKQAEAGLWQRALETFETAKPMSKKEDDAYRLYNIGVANEALGYAAEDPKSAMKFLDEAAINYGKAVDDKPSEKYFLEPQKRIETAIAHYRKLEEARNAPPPEAPPPPAPVVASAPPAKHTSTRSKSTPPKSTPPQSTTPSSATSADGSLTATSHGTVGAHALTDGQVIAMVKNGIDDDTIAQTVRNAKAVNFDLSSAGQQRLTAGGVSPAVVSAMKARAATGQ